MTHARAMIASTAGTRILLVAGALGLVAIAWTRPVAVAPTVATPALASVEEPPLVVRDDAMYRQVDLDGDGVLELVALAQGRSGPVMAVLVRRAPGDYAIVATLPLTSPRSPCASDFTIDDGRLVVEDYAPTDRDDSVCDAVARHIYRLDHGRLVDD